MKTNIAFFLLSLCAAKLDDTKEGTAGTLGAISKLLGSTNGNELEKIGLAAPEAPAVSAPNGATISTLETKLNEATSNKDLGDSSYDEKSEVEDIKSSTKYYKKKGPMFYGNKKGYGRHGGHKKRYSSGSDSGSDSGDVYHRNPKNYGKGKSDAYKLKRRGDSKKFSYHGDWSDEHHSSDDGYHEGHKGVKRSHKGGYASDEDYWHGYNGYNGDNSDKGGYGGGKAPWDSYKADEYVHGVGRNPWDGHKGYEGDKGGYGVKKEGYETDKGRYGGDNDPWDSRKGYKSEKGGYGSDKEPWGGHKDYKFPEGGHGGDKDSWYGYKGHHSAEPYRKRVYRRDYYNSGPWNNRLRNYRRNYYNSRNNWAPNYDY